MDPTLVMVSNLTKDFQTTQKGGALRWCGYIGAE